MVKVLFATIEGEGVGGASHREFLFVHIYLLIGKVLSCRANTKGMNSHIYTSGAMMTVENIFGSKQSIPGK